MDANASEPAAQGMAVLSAVYKEKSPRMPLLLAAPPVAALGLGIVGLIIVIVIVIIIVTRVL